MTQRWPFIRLTRKIDDRSQYQSIGSLNKGATSVEFALIIVPLIALLFGTLQNLLVSTAKVTLDSALQSLAYDAANANSLDLAGIVDRKNLCGMPVLMLVNCVSSPDFCFDVTLLDTGSSIQQPVRTCQSKKMPSQTGCCYQIIVEYQIPTVFDFAKQFDVLMGQQSEPRFIRSVAFVYRS